MEYQCTCLERKMKYRGIKEVVMEEKELENSYSKITWDKSIERLFKGDEWFLKSRVLNFGKEEEMTYRDDKEFIQCMKFVFEQECRHNKDGTLDDGYVWDKDDPGGETKYGISKKAYPKVDIKLLTLDGACDIFYRDYWPIAASLDFPLNVCVFDCAVNQGVKRAAKFLIKSKKDWREFLVIRKAHYMRLYDGPFKNNPKRSVFFKSWIRRIQNVKKFIEVENSNV